MPFDLREAFNVVSDVIVNRPPPIREFDQIYMKVADMLLQAEHVSKWVDDRDTLFVGDGDAIGLTLLHLHQEGVLPHGPRSIHLIDFDERIINSVRVFARRYGLEDRVDCTLYNVADPLPRELWQRFDAFYTNPPFGSANGGVSVSSFVQRGIEATRDNAVAALVVADYPDLRWTQDVLFATQQLLMENGFVIAELIPEFHRYHLDDAPGLTSCSLTARRIKDPIADYQSQALDREARESFYGRSSPLRSRFVIDRTAGGRFPSKDYEIQPLPMDQMTLWDEDDDHDS
jgi:N4-bis(aminopropyl)spermidine synthase